MTLLLAGVILLVGMCIGFVGAIVWLTVFGGNDDAA